MKKYILSLALVLLLSACTSSIPVEEAEEISWAPVNEQADDTETVREIDVTESNGIFTVESKGMDDYVKLVQNPETKDLYLSEAAPEDYEISDHFLSENDTIQKYTEPNPTPEVPLSSLDLIFYLKETSEDGTEIWYGPFQGLMQ